MADGDEPSRSKRDGTLAARLREISKRTGICIPTLMNRYHNLGLREAELEAPVGSYHRRKPSANAVNRIADNGFPVSGYWPSCSKRFDDQIISQALLKWGRVQWRVINPSSVPSR